MAFKRYDGFYSKSLQEKFDSEMAVCPFCGDNPHWLLDLKSGLIKGTVTCMCEKCGAKLYTEGSPSGWDDNLRVIDVGSCNRNNLARNSTYHIQTLGNIKAQFAASGCDNSPPNTLASASSDGTDTPATDAQNATTPTPVPAVTESNGAAESPIKNKWVWLATAVIMILVVGLALFFGLRGGDDKKKTLAETAAIQVISETLKSPSTAIWNEVSYMENNDEGLYIVYVDVEAQNSFGGYIRTKYFVIIYNIDVKEKTFTHNPLFGRIECSGKNDTFNLNLIKSMNNYNGASDEDSGSS